MNPCNQPCNQPHLLIDLNSVFLRYGFALKTHEELIEKTINKVIFLMKKFNTNKVVFFMDKCHNNFRKTIDPNYKNNRKPVPSYIVNELKRMEELLKKHKIPLHSHDEYEADDLIISFAAQHLSIIITTDKDLCQGITEKTKMFLPFRQKLLNITEVQKKYGILPIDIPLYLALVGDSSDNIPGIAGVGPVRAQRILNQTNNMKEIMARTDYDFSLLPKMLSLTLCKSDIPMDPVKDVSFFQLRSLIYNQENDNNEEEEDWSF